MTRFEDNSGYDLETAKKLAIIILQHSFTTGEITVTKKDLEYITRLELTERDFVELSKEANRRAFMNAELK
jgi:hypothetical protein